MDAKRIRALRDRLQCTQQEFAERLGLQTRSAICKLEKGEKAPTGPLKKLLEILDSQTTAKR